MHGMLQVADAGEQTRVLSLSGRVDAGVVEALRSELVAVPMAAGDGFVVDLAAVVLLDSMGIGLLAGVIRRAAAAGAHVVLCAVPDGVRRTLEIAQFHRVVDIFSDREAATQWLAHLAETSSCDA